MGKVDGSGGGAAGGRKSRWRRFSRFFSCVGLGGDAGSSFDHADAPTTPPVVPSASTASDLPPSSACDDSGFIFVTAAPDEPELPTSACDDTSGFCSADLSELEMPTPASDEENRSSPMRNLTASRDSIDVFVADYVEHCRSRKLRDASFPDIFSGVPGCRPKTMFESHAARLRDLAPWVELSYESQLPEYDVDEFGNVDIACNHQAFNEDAFDSSCQSPNTQVTVTENLCSPYTVDCKFE